MLIMGNTATITNPKYAQINIDGATSGVAKVICNGLKEQFGDSIQHSFGTDYDVIYITMAEDEISLDETLREIFTENDLEIVIDKTDNDIHLGLGPITSRKGHFYRVKPV